MRPSPISATPHPRAAGRFITSLSAAATLALALHACGPQSTEDFDLAGDDELTTTNARSDEAFEAWRAAQVREEGGHFYVEGDIRLPDLAAVRAYWDSFTDRPDALAVFVPGGTDATWDRTERLNINYCIRPADFGDDYGRLVELMARAASGWEAVANVRFVHEKAEDGASCDRSNTTVKYNVEHNPDWGPDCRNALLPHCTAPLVAGMGFPSYARIGRYLELGYTALWTDAELLAVLNHEMGHSLGFVHEHDTATGCTYATQNAYRQLTCYDGRGAMHYPSKPGWLDPNRKLNIITQWDSEGAGGLYEQPTNVLATTDGTVYARQPATGDLYKRGSKGTWTKVGNPGQAFLAIGNTLYGQIPNRGAPVKYVGGSTGWTVIGAPMGQIFNCAGALCATGRDSGNVQRYDAASGAWTQIGGPGSRFASTTTMLYGLGPWQDDYVARLSAGSWSVVGQGGSELIGGGTSMYLLTNTKDAIQRHDGGSTWTTIGLSGRAFAAVGSQVYGLTPDRKWVMKYAGANWVAIHGAATRLFSSGGALFVTNPDDTIERYNPSTGVWTSLGKP